MDQAINSQAIFYSWPSAAIAASLVLLTAVIALRIVLKILKRWQRQHDALRTMVDCTEEPALLAVSALALQVVWQASSDTLHLITGVRHFTVVVLIGALTWLVIRMLRAASRIIAVMYPSTADDNLHARRIQTQARMLGRTFMVFVFLFGLAAALMTFPSVRQIGMGMLASAGVAGLVGASVGVEGWVGGFAAKPLLGNLLAGLQIALTQPIRLDDVVIVEGEWGRITEIAGSYVVVALWDERRLIVPLQWFIEHPFQNWTQPSSQIVGAVLLWVDFGFPVDALRKELAEICAHRAEWDHRVCVAQV